MSKAILYFVVAVLGVAGFIFWENYTGERVQEVRDYKDATYVINGEEVSLKDGRSETSVLGSSAKIVTEYFGNEARYDLDADGREDVVFLLTQNSGGSGVFYYVVAALNTEGGYVGSQGLFLGDRIAPQTTEMGKGKIVIVNYADRAPGESFAMQPSIGKSIWLLLDPESRQFGEVAQNFEGEADISRMTLTMKNWQWVEAFYSDGRRVVPERPADFTLWFFPDGTFEITTDCNAVGGFYYLEGEQLTFSDMDSTLMYCEESQDAEFVSLLANTTSHHFTSRGELVLDLKFDSGSVTFVTFR